MTGHSPARDGRDNARDGRDISTRKRIRTDEHSPTGLKRDKYTVVACNECRKRKIKCSGDSPCRRCINHDLSCAYADHGVQNSSKMRITTLEQDMLHLEAQVEQLSASLKQVQEGSYNRNSVLDARKYQINGTHNTHRNIRRGASPTQPQFIGPTSYTYNFNIANTALQKMGIEHSGLDTTLNGESSRPSRSGSLEIWSNADVLLSDPLLAIDTSTVYHALQVYEEDLNPNYPFIPLEEITRSVPLIYEHLRQNHKSAHDEIQHQCCSVNNQDVNVLKLLVASALVFEGHGKSCLGNRLVHSTESGLSTSVGAPEVDLKMLQILTMTSIYHFHCDEQVLAWRTIGIAAQIAFEMGLHRKDSLEQFLSVYQRERAVRLFWCIYVLDRRWSFGTGMPFAIQDSDIDPELPRIPDSEPYLACMVAYGSICSKVWNAVAGFGTKRADKDTVGFLEFQIQQWVQSIPAEFQLIHPRLGEIAREQPQDRQFLRVLLYIRGNHMRAFVHRHNVLSTANITKNLAGARLVTDIAKDTITVLVHLRETSKIYERQQNAFNYFLVSAISAIFLAVCHAPVEFSRGCREEFHSALSLLNDLSAHSHTSKRLWKSVRHLRNIAPRLGLSPQNTEYDDTAHSNNPINPRRIATGNNGVSMSSSDSAAIVATRANPATSIMSMPDMPPSNIPDMLQIGNDLTSLFDALGEHFGEQGPYVTAQDGMTDEVNLLQNGNEVSRLFEGLL